MDCHEKLLFSMYSLTGKVESAMDHLTHTNPMFKEHADIAANHYDRFEEDIGFAKQLKVKQYRMVQSSPQMECWIHDPCASRSSFLSQLRLMQFDTYKEKARSSRCCFKTHAVCFLT